MSVRVVDLAAPPSVLEAEEKAAERVERLRRAQLKTLSEKQTTKLQKYLQKVLKAERKETMRLRSRLVRYDDLLNGVVEETTFPFEGASNITLRYAMGLARTFKAAFNKTVYGDEELFYPVLDPGAEKELKLDQAQLQVLQEGFNHSFSTKYNGLSNLKSGTIPAFRDGIFLVEGSWERRVERVNDQRTYRSLEEFQQDYPDAKSIGGAADEYVRLMNFFLVEGEEAELVVRFSHDHVQFEGAEYRSLLRAKFVSYPTSARKLSEADIYGCYFDLQKDDLKRRGKRKEFYEKGVEQSIKRNESQSLDEWDKNRLYIEGLTAPDADEGPVRCVDVVVKFDLDDDGTREQYRVQASVKNDLVFLLSCRPYDLRHNVPGVVPLRLVGRDHAFDGHSLVGDGEDLFNQIDTLFRHDNNVMMLTTSPIFIADQTLKEQLDLGRAENVIRPGVTYWVPNIETGIKQLPVADIAAASGDNNTKMSIITRFIELLIGVSQGESGQQSPDDPNAPARKTQLLLLQSNRRIDECIDEWTLSFPELAKLHATLLYQYSPERKYEFMDRQGQPKSFDLKNLADPRLRWSPRRRSVTLTPEFALARLQSLFQTYAAMKPLLQQGDQVAIELWNRTVRNSGEPQAEKFLIDNQQAGQMAQEAMQKALKMAEMQSMMKAKAKGQEKLATESAKQIVKHISEGAQSALSGAGQAEAAAASAAGPGQAGPGQVQ